MTFREFFFGLIGAAVAGTVVYFLFAFVGGDLNWVADLYRVWPKYAEEQALVMIGRLFVAVVGFLAVGGGFILGVLLGDGK